MTSTKSFKLFKSSLICFLLASVYFIYIYIDAGLIAIPHYMGRLIGTVLIFFIIPLIFSLIAWKFSENKEKSSTQTFIFVLVLLFFSSLNNLIKLNETGFTPEKANIVADYFISESESQTGLHKKFSLITAKHIKQALEISEKWSLSYQNIPDLNEYDYSLFKNKKSHIDLKKILREYIVISKEFRQYTNEYIQNTNNQFTKEEQNQDIYKAFLEGMQASMLTRKPIIQELGDARVEFGEAFIKYNDLLHNNPSLWRLVNDEMVVDSELFKEIKELSTSIYYNSSVIYEKSIELTQMDISN